MLETSAPQGFQEGWAGMVVGCVCVRGGAGGGGGGKKQKGGGGGGGKGGGGGGKSLPLLGV